MTHEEHAALLAKQDKNIPPGMYEKFEVPGAGTILISTGTHYLTGDVAGFDFGVSWGRAGYVGGVIGRLEAIRLAEFILERCASMPESMHQEVERTTKELLGDNR